jgi:hypothetical protein
MNRTGNDDGRAGPCGGMTMRRISRALRAAGLAVLLAGPVVVAGPAAAAGPPMNQSYAVYATGRMSTQPVGQASYSGGSPVILPNADAAGLLDTGLITDAAGPASASSRIPGLAVTLRGQAVLRARLASSSCRFDPQARAASGAARVDQGRIIQAGHRTIALPASAAPNTRIVVPDVAVITLNHQFTGARGTLTVQAMRIRLLDHQQKLVLATSVCAAANLAPAPAMGGPAFRLTLGGLGLVLLGGLAYLLRRRSRRRAA